MLGLFLKRNCLDEQKRLRAFQLFRRVSTSRQTNYDKMKRDVATKDTAGTQLVITIVSFFTYGLLSDLFIERYSKEGR